MSAFTRGTLTHISSDEIGKYGLSDLPQTNTLCLDEITTIQMEWNKRWDRVLVLSDLHLGTKDASDMFRHDPGIFIKWINSYDPDLIVLNGDIFELWTENLSSIYKSYSHLIDRLKNSFFLRGNHDCLPRTPDNLELYFPSGETFLISHGFQNDSSTISEFGKNTVWYLNKLKNSHNLLGYGLDTITSAFIFNTIIKNTNLYAESAIDQFGYNAVIHGHTHAYPSAKYYHKNLIVNDGSCQEGRYRGALIFKDARVDIIND